MPEMKKREKVVAEITLAHLQHLAAEQGRRLSYEEALAFLNCDGRAYAMWKNMMRAGEEYIKTALREQYRPVGIARPATLPRNRMVV